MWPSILAIAATLCFLGPVQNSPAPPAAAAAVEHGEKDGINWVNWSEASERNSKKRQARPVLVDFYTDWCGWCKRQDATTFRDPRVVAYLNKHYHAIKFDAEGNETIAYNGKTLKRTGKTHEWALQLATRQGRIGYPTMVILDETGAPLTVLPGYHTPEKLLPLLAYYGEGYYRDFDFATFEGMYTLPLNPK